jgi:hypothetical protein
VETDKEEKEYKKALFFCRQYKNATTSKEIRDEKQEI